MEHGKIPRLATRSFAQAIDDLLTNHGSICTILNSLQEAVILTDDERRIVFANRRFLQLMEAGKRGKVLGLLPGKALGCIHAKDKAPSFEETEVCKKCGSLFSVLPGEEDRPGVREYTVRQSRDGSMRMLTFRASGRQVVLGDHAYTLFSLVDISEDT